MRLTRASRPARDAALLLLAWFGVTFALFTFMGTKFHHYIAPAVPPLAILVGVGLDGFFEARAPAAGPDEPAAAHARAMRAAACVAGALLVGLVARDLLEGQNRLMQLFTYRYDRAWPASLDATRAFEISGALAFVLAVLLAVPRARRWAAMGFVALAVGTAAWGLDVYLPEASPHWGQRP